MRRFKSWVGCLMTCLAGLILTACASTETSAYSSQRHKHASKPFVSYESRLPGHLNTGGRKTVLIDPNVHAWGAYDGNGNLVRAGVAVSGADYCPDIHRRCHTSSGSFSVFSLGSASCKSTRYPVGRGGAPMPYCMFFNKNQAMHGSYELGSGNANLSHGCVRLRVEDAAWLRFNFVTIGTRVIIRPY